MIALNGDTRHLPDELRGLLADYPMVPPDTRVVELAAGELEYAADARRHARRAMRELDVALGGADRYVSCVNCRRRRKGVNGAYCTLHDREVTEYDGCTWGSVM